MCARHQHNGNILLDCFQGVQAEERLYWRSFLVKIGTDNLNGAHNEELFVASHKFVYVIYTTIGYEFVFVVSKDEYDELALTKVLYMIISSIKDVCKKAPIERAFLEKYGKVCLCLDEIVFQETLEHTKKIAFDN
ncbi:hypothetical protein GOP47_0014347 [Adiantum capillus-veneris]|uniref:Coatomer subunit zeta n=1 Tax=Adiantum capillus-veneris TaxID=13818 RepID=A0A9D4ULW0_ADICA|nr:hypothetical protein GOP47_0014347 [Adiantum capillus-veneris]